MEQHQVLCRNGCGFFANQGNEGLCSVCYKELIRKKQQPPVNMPASLTSSRAATSIKEVSSTSSSSLETAAPTVVLPSSPIGKEEEMGHASSSSESDKRRQEGGKIKKNRCLSCKKKVGLSGGFECRCGGLFCPIHRYSDKHECSFDYKQHGAEEIRKSNPTVVASKVPKF